MAFSEWSDPNTNRCKFPTGLRSRTSECPTGLGGRASRTPRGRPATSFLHGTVVFWQSFTSPFSKSCWSHRTLWSCDQHANAPCSRGESCHGFSIRFFELFGQTNLKQTCWCVCEQSDIEDEVNDEGLKTRRETKQQRTNYDCWDWIDDDTLVRKRRTPRRSRISPQEWTQWRWRSTEISNDNQEPTDEELSRFHKEIHLSQHKNRRDLARDDFEDFKLAFEGAEIIRETLKYLINCGWTTPEIKLALGASEKGRAMLANRHQYSWESAEYQKWRKHAWEDLQRRSSLVRRAIAGTYGVTSYTYFRPEATYSSAKYLNPLAIVLALKSAGRTIAVLHVLQNYKIEMNDGLITQLEKGKERSRKEPGCAPGWGALLEEGLLKSICNIPSGTSTSWADAYKFCWTVFLEVECHHHGLRPLMCTSTEGGPERHCSIRLTKTEFDFVFESSNYGMYRATRRLFLILSSVLLHYVCTAWEVWIALQP